MIPTVKVLAPRTVTRNTGSSAWIISEEMSMNRLTKPSAQMLRGKRVPAVAAAFSSVSFINWKSHDAISSQAIASLT